jgi:hypothetical protein
MDIIRHHVFYLEHNALETGFCLRLQVEPTQLGPIDIASLDLWTRGRDWLKLLDPTEYVPPEDGDTSPVSEMSCF